jgi:probable HAF family extracellular repeat protein
VSADGSIVTGTSDSPESPFALQAFSWTAEEGMVGLGDLPGGDFSSEANDISADGTTIVGGSWSESGFEAFIWTADTGMFGLGDLPRGDFNSTALGVSADGSVVVGRSDSGSSHLPTDAMIWSADEGMRKLKDVLQDDFGLDLFTVILTSATAVSDDGRTIIGQGCFGSRCASPITIEPWIATLPDAIAFDRSLCSGLLEPDETDGVDPEETNPGDTDDLTGNSNTASPAGGRPNRPCGSGILAYTLVLGAVLGFLPRVRRRRA